MTGLIWFVQIVHYPLFAVAGPDHFVAYEAAHTRLTTYVVGPLMLVELAACVMIVLGWGGHVRVGAAWGGAALLAVIWLSTAALQVPQHSILMNGFDPQAHRRLVDTNWIRTVAWSARGVLALWMVHDAAAAT